MRKYKPKRRYSISKPQELVLVYLFKYRFMTSDLLAEILVKDRSTIYERLSVLEQQGYIAKQYDSTFRIRGRSATYHLAPKGIRYLKHHGAERTQLHYKSKNFTEEQIEEQLMYARVSLALSGHYQDKFITYTKYQLEHGKYLMPTSHLLFKGKSKNTPDYLLEVFPAFTMSWRIRKRINQHVDAANEFENKYPYLLLVAGNDNTERRIINMTSDLYADFEVFTSTLDRLMSGEKNVWVRPEEVDWDEALEFCELLVKF